MAGVGGLKASLAGCTSSVYFCATAVGGRVGALRAAF
jgi:hypothetical protein